MVNYEFASRMVSFWGSEACLPCYHVRFAWSAPASRSGVSLSSASLSFYISDLPDTDQANWPPADRAQVTAWLTAVKSTSVAARTGRSSWIRNRPAIKARAYSPRLPFTPYYSLLSASPTHCHAGRAPYSRLDLTLRPTSHYHARPRLHLLRLRNNLQTCATETEEQWRL